MRVDFSSCRMFGMCRKMASLKGIQRAIIVLRKNTHCLSGLRWAAALHLAHIISGGSAEIGGL